jgi:hypothetical protein
MGRVTNTGSGIRVPNPEVTMTLEEKPKNAAEHLAEMTDRPESEFTADLDEYPIPDLEDLEWERLDDDESPFTDS